MSCYLAFSFRIAVKRGKTSTAARKSGLRSEREPGPRRTVDPATGSRGVRKPRPWGRGWGGAPGPRPLLWERSSHARRPSPGGSVVLHLGYHPWGRGSGAGTRRWVGGPIAVGRATVSHREHPRVGPSSVLRDRGAARERQGPSPRQSWGLGVGVAAHVGRRLGGASCSVEHSRTALRALGRSGFRLRSPRWPKRRRVAGGQAQEGARKF